MLRQKILFILLFKVFTLYSQDQCTPVGWAAQNGSTTGGGNVSPVTVTTLSELQAQANSSGSKVIYVSGVMGAGVGTRVSVSSNKTIFGLPGATLNGGFDIKNASNVILRNMIIKGPGAIDVDGVDCITIDNSTNVWIDHCNISDGQDGNLDIVNGSNYISVTWTKFHYTSASVNHKFSSLIGNSDTKTSDRGKLKVTMMFNHWDASCVERMPRVRFGQVHVVNNLFDSPNANHCVRAGIEADIRVENNVFKGVNKPIDLYENNFTAVTSVGNLFINTSGNTSGSGTAFIPPYSLSILPAANVESIVRSCVGATLSYPAVCPCGNPMPVNLVYFNVYHDHDEYLLSWLLTGHDNLKEIQIEISLDGTSFEQAASLDRTATFYSWPAGLNQFSYVRLRFIENDGTTTLSPVRSLSLIMDIQIYPNPFNEYIFVQSPEEISITIFSSSGKIIFEDIFNNMGVIPVSDLIPGVYLIVANKTLSGEGKKKTLVKF
jgi:pectate lyase